MRPDDSLARQDDLIIGALEADALDFLCLAASGRAHSKHPGVLIGVALGEMFHASIAAEEDEDRENEADEEFHGQGNLTLKIYGILTLLIAFCQNVGVFHNCGREWAPE